MAFGNQQVILISGSTSTGKSFCLQNLPKPEGVMYLNCEDKRLPFKSQFMHPDGADGSTGFQIIHPTQVIDGFEAAENMPNCHTIVVDTLDRLMEKYESEEVLTAPDTRSAWQSYKQYFKTLMQKSVAQSSKHVIFLAHTMDIHNEQEMIVEKKVPIAGSLKAQGVESYFTNVVSTKKVPLSALEGFENDMLNISEKEQMRGFKYVFQTDITKDTINERMRSPVGMWSTAETFIDNDATHVLKRLHEYYGESSHVEVAA